MSVIHLGLTPDLAGAVNCKTSNETVSKKTLWKLDNIAFALYYVGNRSNLLDACRQLGLMRLDVRSNDLDRGLRDVVNAQVIVAGMRKSRAKSQLTWKLHNIERMMRARTKECMNVILHREAVCTHALKHGRVILLYPNAGGRSDPQARKYERKLEKAIAELGPKLAEQAEEKRSAMLVGRSTDPEDATHRH